MCVCVCVYVCVCEKYNNSGIERCKSIFLESPYCTANCLQRVRSSGPGTIMCESRATRRAFITCNTPSLYHVQQIEPLSRAPRRAFITCNTSSLYHVHHVEPLSRATRRAFITCNTSNLCHVQHVEPLSRATRRAFIACLKPCVWICSHMPLAE